jgi:hypothetical protein
MAAIFSHRNLWRPSQTRQNGDRVRLYGQPNGSRRTEARIGHWVGAPVRIGPGLSFLAVTGSMAPEGPLESLPEASNNRNRPNITLANRKAATGRVGGYG